MSASQMERLACTHAQSIPSKRIMITDSAQLPDVYSSTPGGTLYSTTPGGTRVIYERAFLMNLKNSPLSRTPPNNIPSGLIRGNPNTPRNKALHLSRSPPKSARNDDRDEEQFHMDI